MFGNYYHRHIPPDSSYFDAKGDEEAFLKARPPLSEEIIQGYKSPNPWPTSPTFEGDFVLLCEFSELEGPKPLMTIPKDSGGDFDQNDFALRIMAIDYNATNTIRAGGYFSLIRDTGIVLEEPKQSAYAYVHHLTLYDVIARGYVRPFCMAYITSDKRKIVSNLEWFTRQFGKVSEAFCYGNCCQFKKDLDCRLADILYTIDGLIAENPRLKLASNLNGNLEGGEHCLDDEGKLHRQLSALETGIQEVKNIQEVLSPELKNSKLEAKFRKQELLSRMNRHHKARRWHRSNSSYSDAVQSDGIHSNCVHSDGVHSDGVHSDGVHSDGVHSDGVHSDGVCSNDTPSDDVRSNDSNSDVFHSDSAHSNGVYNGDVHSDREERSSVHLDNVTPRRANSCESISDLTASLDCPYAPKIIRMDGYRKFDIRLRTLHELCGWGYKTAMNRLRAIHQHICRNPLILHMEKQEAKLVEPASALLTIGRTVMINFMQDMKLTSGDGHRGLGVHHEKRLHRLTSNISASSNSLSFDEQSLPSRNPSLSYEARFVPGTAYASVESLYYDVNEDLSSDEDSVAEIPKRMLSGGLLVQSEDGSWLDIVVNSGDGDRSSPGQLSSKIRHTPTDEMEESASTSIHTVPDNVDDSNSTSPMSSGGDRLQECRVLPSSSINSYVIRRHHKVSIGCYASRINSFNTYLPGSGVRNVIGQYSFAIHLVYALLCGRTVIIVSSPKYEKEVASIVRALWLFVPGHSSNHHLVVPWHTRPLCLLDLSRMKLVGLSRHKSAKPIIPKAVQRYSSVFDYEASTIWTPPYKGSCLNLLVKSYKCFRSDQAYIAFIHSIFLDMAKKAFVYYHSYCLNSPPNFQSTDGLDMVEIKSLPSSFRTGAFHLTQTSEGYLGKLGITDGDVDIIQYWVEIIKQQITDERYLQADSSLETPPSVHLYHRQCKKYQV